MARALSSAASVLELSRAILGGSRGFIAVLKVFIDESGTHDGSPVVTVAAYMARPRQWQLFTKEWRAAIRPAKVYHATDAANRRGEFKNWTREQVDAVAARALPVIVRNTEYGLAVGVQMDHLNEALRERPDLRAAFGSAYAICLYAVMGEILDGRRRFESDERMAFFHEENSYKREALDAYEAVLRDYNQANAPTTFTFGSKQDYVPLQAADVFAYEANKKLRDTARPDRRALQALEPESGRLSFRAFDRTNMPWLVWRLGEAVSRGLVLGKAGV
jgi:hypothetical protein